MRLPALALIATAGASMPGAVSAADPVLLRIENRSGAPAAVGDLRPELQRLLVGKGYEAVEAQATDAPVLEVTLSVYLGPKTRTRGPKAGAAAGLSAVLRAPDGTIVWRNAVAIIGQDETISYTRLRRADPVKALASNIAEKLLWTLPRARSAPPETAALGATPQQEVGPVEVSTRYEAPLRRLRTNRTVARFALKIRR